MSLANRRRMYDKLLGEGRTIPTCLKDEFDKPAPTPKKTPKTPDVKNK